MLFLLSLQPREIVSIQAIAYVHVQHLSKLLAKLC